MATAVQTPTALSPAGARTRLVFTSIAGSLLLLGGVVCALALPTYWDQSVAPALVGAIGPFLAGLLRVLAQLALLVAPVLVINTLFGQNAPRGLRGGLLLTVSAIVTVFFVVRAIGLNLETSTLDQYASIVTMVILGAFIALTYRLLSSEAGTDAMKTIEDEGLVSFKSYKPALGAQMRRYTLFGLLLLTLSGVYSLVSHNMLSGSWVLEMPFVERSGRFLVLMRDLYPVAPILLAAAAFYLSWRVVNMPTFADFLTSTESEMKKVTWSTRKRLVQDTIVVLVTLALMTVFFLLVDFFWSWLLSQEFIGVLPSQSSGGPAPIRASDW